MSHEPEQQSLWSPKDIGDFTFALTELMDLYGKKLEHSHTKFWVGALAQKPLELVLRAIAEYAKTGKYAPKPVDIIELVEAQKSRQRGMPKPAAEDFSGKADPLIAQAWVTYIRFAHGMEIPGHRNTPPMPIERALEIVNREASKHDRPDSILPEHRIAEFWGEIAA